MIAAVAETRHVAGVAATLSIVGVDSDGEPADPGTVTVGVVNSAGAELVAAGTATGSAKTFVDDDTRTVALAATATAQVDRLTATWTASGVVIATTHHDVVGGVYVSTPQIRAAGSALNDAAKYSKAALLKARREVEEQFEHRKVCGRAFVPRFEVEQFEFDCRVRTRIPLRWPDLRSVRWASRWNGSAWEPLSVSGIPSDDAGILCLPSGSAGWSGFVRVGYEHGLDRPPGEVQLAAVKAIEHRLQVPFSGIDSRAISVQGTELGNVTLATPGLSIWVTAIPEVDEALKRYTFRRGGVA